ALPRLRRKPDRLQPQGHLCRPGRVAAGLVLTPPEYPENRARPLSGHRLAARRPRPRAVPGNSEISKGTPGPAWALRRPFSRPLPPLPEEAGAPNGTGTDSGRPGFVKLLSETCRKGYNQHASDDGHPVVASSSATCPRRAYARS